MIVLDNVTKYYETNTGRHYVLRNVNCTFVRGKHVAILGRNGAGKSTLFRLIGGAEKPNEGEIRRKGQVSWPLGLIGGFQGSLSGRENAEFVCQIHGLDGEQTEAVVNYVLEFSELGDYYEMPVKTYSSGMGSRLRFALSLSFRFDFYLVDELTSVGDAVFKRKTNAAFQRLRDRASILLASHNFKTLQENCDAAIVLSDEGLTCYDTVAAGIKAYKRSLRGLDEI